MPFIFSFESKCEGKLTLIGRNVHVIERMSGHKQILPKIPCLFNANRSFHVRPCIAEDKDGVKSLVAQVNGADDIMR